MILVLSACGNGGSGDPAEGEEQPPDDQVQVNPPARIAEAGKLTFCTSPPYPPIIFQEGDQVVGSDVDFGEAVAETMGVDADWITIGFDGFIAAVQGGRCDGYLGASTHTEERAEQVHFTDYVVVGRQYLVPAGNPLGIHSEEDLCGKAVSVLIGTTEEARLQELSDSHCEPNGLGRVNVQTFSADTDAGLALVQDKVDAYGTDFPGLTFYIEEHPGDFEYALPEPVDAAPYGIATRLDDTELHRALQEATDLLYENGTMCQILEEWGLTQIALQPCP